MCWPPLCPVNMLYLMFTAANLHVYSHVCIRLTGNDILIVKLAGWPYQNLSICFSVFRIRIVEIRGVGKGGGANSIHFLYKVFGKRSVQKECSPPIDDIDISAMTHDELVMLFGNKIFEPLYSVPSTVVNLSRYTPSHSELSLLERGLNFCPTPGEPDMGDLRRDLDRFHRNLRINTFFDPKRILDEPKSQNSQNPQPAPPPQDEEPSEWEKEIRKSKLLKSEKVWQPPKGPLHLESFILTNEHDLNNTFVKSPRGHNISREERQSMKNLPKTTDIVIKQADKGGATVILDRADYIKEGRRQLSDTSFYTKLDADPTEHNNLRVNALIDSLKTREEISRSLSKKLQNFSPNTPELYLLPKIHKGTRPPPGRPIVSANGCPTEKISAFVDIFLKPHLPKITSYLRDTTDLLVKLENLPTPKAGSILCSLDVSSLYTNIPNFEGRQAVGRFLAKHRQWGTGPEPSNQSICHLLNMVLTMNNFRFDIEHYLQVSGTAMGTRVAPTYANIFMADFEDKYVYTYPKHG